MSNTLHNELGEYAVRAGPAVTSTGLTFMGVPIADIVQVLVAVYTILQIGLLVYNKIIKPRMNKNGS